MFLKRVLCAGVCACLAFPTVFAAASHPSGAGLVISAHAAQKSDASLQGFVRQVWTASPAVQGAQAAIEAAQARLEGAGQPLHNPSLALDAERTAVNTASIGLNQTLDWSDKKGAQVNVVERQLQAAQARLLETRQRVAVEALEAVVSYFTAHQMQALAQRRSELMKGFVDAVQQRRAAGDVAALDVTLAQVAYSEALMVEAASASQLAEAEAALQAVSGLTAASWPTLPGELASAPASVDASLLQRLPGLAVLRSQMEAARARIKVAERQGQIDPTVGIRAGRDDSDTLLGLSLEIPLFVRNNYKAQVREASHEAVAQEMAYRDAYRRAEARLEGALGRFQHTSSAWLTWGETGQAALREQMGLLEQMWQAGELSATDFLIQTKQNIDTQATATELLGEVWRSAIAWLAASGQVELWLGLSDQSVEKSAGERK
ncbi:MAG TPA: TolC family protein [Candidatus Tenderia sp.]|nr:TolC family protein [Candidatus Tenderia sp.]